MTHSNLNRRDLIKACAALGLAPDIAASSGNNPMRTKAIPASGEELPVVGLGTYRVFDTDSTATEIASRQEIVELLRSRGGRLLDTSPMYNRSEKVIGDVIASGADRSRLFLATKVWTDGQNSGLQQMQRSRELMQTDVIDLMQVHNLRDTKLHMQTIREWQQQGRIRYSGLAHYTDSSQTALANEMRQFKPDFIQINYSIGDRAAERQLLPMAADQGVAVLINRPFQAGSLFKTVAGQSVPEWADEFAQSWGQFFLKFIISHPAVTCVIPATSKPRHMIDNLGAGVGPLPDQTMRQRMVDYFESL